MEMSSKKYDVFICYETTTGFDFATNIKEALRKLSFNAFVAKSDIPAGVNNETEFRYEIIQSSEHFIIVFTNLTFQSGEVRNEVQEALKNNRKFIICLDSRVEAKRFQTEFPELANKQRTLPFSNSSELCKHVTDIFDAIRLKESQNSIKGKDIELIHEEKKLIIEPKWSITPINESQKKGKIIFKVRNLTPNRILLYGYKMFRIHPTGEKDFFYCGISKSVEEFSGWLSDPHFNIILWHNDEHTFHWNEVDIETTYGINSKGTWQIELQIAFIIDSNQSQIFTSTGISSIKYD